MSLTLQPFKLLIYSGGLDSTAMLCEQRKVISCAVFFNYGSKHNEREYLMAQKNCARFGIELLTVDLKSAMSFMKSALLQEKESIPLGHYEDETMKKTVVPFRNGIMASIAAGIAESRGLTEILIATHAGDHAIYPDCRPEWLSAMNVAIKAGTGTDIELSAPYIYKTKRNICLQVSDDLNMKFEDTYSCYLGGELHCGQCGTCTERKEALQGFDPTKYLN